MTEETTMKIETMSELSSSQEIRADRRQFAKNCMDFVQSTMSPTNISEEDRSLISQVDRRQFSRACVDSAQSISEFFNKLDSLVYESTKERELFNDLDSRSFLNKLYRIVRFISRPKGRDMNRTLTTSSFFLSLLIFNIFFQTFFFAISDSAAEIYESEESIQSQKVAEKSYLYKEYERNKNDFISRVDSYKGVYDEIFSTNLIALNTATDNSTL